MNAADLAHKWQLRLKKIEHRKPALFHVTPSCNIESIARDGILVSRAQTGRPVVWLCAGYKVKWALNHVANHHIWPVDQMRVIKVVLGNLPIRKYRRGIWVCTASIPRSHLFLFA